MSRTTDKDLPSLAFLRFQPAKNWRIIVIAYSTVTVSTIFAETNDMSPRFFIKLVAKERYVLL